MAFAAVLSVSLVAGSAAHAEDDSSVTVTARSQDIYLKDAPMPDLAVTVSQTRNLQAQAVTVSWTGGVQSTLPSGQTGGENHLQIMQCWGDVINDDAESLPARTTCQFGGFGTAGAKRDNTRDSPDHVAAEDARYSHLGANAFDPTYTGIPFRSVPDPVTGESTVITRVNPDGTYVESEDPINLNSNEFFTKYTTNEVPWAGSAADGSGSVTFELQNVMQSPGLGCGAPVTASDGSVSGRPCWLVVVPRGAGTNTDSPLFWEQWKHKVAVRLDFQPVGTRCAIGAAERQLAGTELISDAVSSWQPALCGADGGSAYTLLTTTDTDAAASSNVEPDAPLTLTSQPLDTAGGGVDQLAYAPVALTGVAVTFAIDRYPLSTAPDDAQERARQPFTEMNLTPRLLAKLLTSSYTDALPTNADVSHLGRNPRSLLADPDFLAVNDPEWAQQAIVSPAIADIMTPQGRSGYARAIWTYIMADADARAFLAGQPDRWGMIVNPYASTDPAINPTGSALELPRDDFPKVDPNEAYAGEPRVLNAVTWRPYTNDLAAGAYYTLRGDGLTVGEWDPLALPAKWLRSARNLVGDRKVLALTDTSSSHRYNTITASLRNPGGQFVAPTTDNIAAAAAAMTASPAQSQVLAFDPTSSWAKAATSAYPLALPVYAATNPSLGSDDVRASYAAFVRYAVADGQAPGADPGQLPSGYTPLPQAWRTQALAVAAQLESAPAPAPAPAAPAAQPAAVPAAAAAPVAPAAAAPVAAADPGASGAAAGALSAGTTPDDPDTGGLTQALPLSILAGVIAACTVPLVGFRRRP